MITVIKPPTAYLTADVVRSGMPALAAVEDALLEVLVGAIAGELDGPGGILGRAIARQTLELSRPDFPCADGWIGLPCPPVASIVSVTYRGHDGADIVMPADQYHLGAGVLAPVGSWPPAASGLDSVRIRYLAGPETMHDTIAVAVKLRVADAYAAMQRGDETLKKVVVEGIGSREWHAPSSARTATDRVVDRLLAPFKVMAV